MIKVLNYNIPIFIFCKICFFFLCIVYHNKSASSTLIKEIATSAYGNNQFEAKIKAQHKAFNNAFKILWDKYNLIDDPLKNRINYYELKKIFTIQNLEEEKYVGNNYQGILTLQYDISQFYNFIFSNINKNSPLDKSFNEYIVIVIEKRNENVQIVSKQFAIFAKNFFSKQLQENRIMIYNMNNEQLLNDIHKITFADFEQIVPEALVKNILFLTYEVFTNNQDMSNILNISYLEIDYNNTKNTAKFSIKVKNNHIKNEQLFQLIMNNLIKNYSQKSNIPPSIKKKPPSKSTKTVKTAVNVQNLSFKLKTDDTIILHQVQNKLSQIDKSVMNFKIQTSSKNEYNIDVKLKGSLEDLGEEFYIVGLSYIVQDNKYYLLNISSGV